MKTKQKEPIIDKHIRLTLLKASEEFGVSRETMRRALAAAGIKPGADGKYSIRECHAALSGDARTARGRLTTAKAKLAELELRVRERDLISREECAFFIVSTFSPLRESIVSMPGNLAAQVNPADPAHARAHLERFRDEYIKLKYRVPKEEPEKQFA